MKAETLIKLRDELQKLGVKVVGTTDEFRQVGEEYISLWEIEQDPNQDLHWIVGLWCSAEEALGEVDHQDLFNYHTTDHKRYEFGVSRKLVKIADKYDFYFEWNDAGTIMCWPI